jgi:hypothetical protein
MGDFEVAITGGIWVAAGVSRVYAVATAPGLQANRWDVRFAAPDTDKIDVVTVNPSVPAAGEVPSCVDPG